MVLSAGPTLTGVVRLAGLAVGRDMLADHARLAAQPIPLVLHIASATAFALLGAWQFSTTLRRRPWHRTVGRALAPFGIVAAISGMWLAIASPPAEPGATVLSGLRVASGAAMVAFIAVGLVALSRRDFAAHGAWMTRAYAVGVSAGTQFFLALPYAVLVDERSPSISAPLLGLLGVGWAINLAVAEWSLRRRSAARSVVNALEARCSRA
jgi:uncharacterized membrane protein YozB (DUF420 family)